VYLVSVIERFQADAAIDKAFRAKQGKRISDLLAINAKLNSNISQLKEEKLEAINEKEELEIDLVNSISIINNKINA
jgi:predicted phage gp36 major capsid-like protein